MTVTAQDVAAAVPAIAPHGRAHLDRILRTLEAAGFRARLA